jgi:hypothetical protein
MSKNYKPTVAIDFDGVIHSYTSGWQGVDECPDPMVPGIDTAIADLRTDHKVIVVSSRAATPEGRIAIRDYLKKYNIEVDGIQNEKPPCIVSIDDRAICFNGYADILAKQVREFKPWYSKNEESEKSE